MYEEILAAVIKTLEEVLEDEEISVTPESDLMDDLCLSSLEMLNMLMDLEDDHGIEIPEKYLKRMITVQDVAEVLCELAELYGEQE